MTATGHEELFNYIAGTWRASHTGKSIENTNPADTREVLGRAADSDRSDMDRAIAAAEEAFPRWRQVPAPARGDLLLRVMQLLTERKETVSRALCLEEGKTLAESRGEVQKAINLLEFVAGESLRWGGQTVPSELPRTFAYTVRASLGVVGLITPWNFPVAIPIWKLAPALVAGNSVVFKPSPLTPWTAQLVVQIFEDAGLPKGVLNLVHGGAAPAQALVEHPSVVAISFTGSTRTGTEVYSVASRSLKKVQCEMGGKNPVIVLEDADLDLAAAATVQGAFGSTGQRCTATARAVVVEAVADAFVARVRALAAALRVGPGIAPETDVGPSVSAAQLEKVLEYHQVARAEGLERILGDGARLGGSHAHGYFSAPVIYDRVPEQSRLVREEIFGPVLIVQRARDFADAIRLANGSEYGLSSSIFTQDVARAMEYADQVETGMLHVNSATVGGEAQLPFGGMKATGVGPREMGPTAIEFFSQWKTVYIDYTGTRRDTKIY